MKQLQIILTVSVPINDRYSYQSWIRVNLENESEINVFICVHVFACTLPNKQLAMHQQVQHLETFSCAY